MIEGPGWEQVITCGVPWVIAYAAATGEEVWRAKCMEDGSWAAPSPVQAGGRVFAVVEDAVLAAIRLGGKGDVTKTHLLWTATDNLPSVCSPVTNGELVFTLTSSGTLTCYSPNDGRKLWEKDYSDSEAVFGASPAIAGGRLYLLDSSGRAFILKASARLEEIGRAELGEPCPGASPAFKNGRIYLRSKSNLYGIGTLRREN